MDRGNHYEAAFDAYLNSQFICHVPVDETRRIQHHEGPIKSLDFFVNGKEGQLLVVDVKGRRFPGGKESRPRYVWECWSTAEDVAGLERWAAWFGPDCIGVLVFAYQLGATFDVPPNTDDLWTWRGQRYLFRAVAIEDYRQHMRVRSPKWGTVTLPGAMFRRLVRPLHHFTHGPLLAPEDAVLGSGLSSTNRRTPTLQT